MFGSQSIQHESFSFGSSGATVSWPMSERGNGGVGAMNRIPNWMLYLFAATVLAGALFVLGGIGMEWLS